MTRVRVVGAGLSGLSAAWFLAERGLGVDVIEDAAPPAARDQGWHAALPVYDDAITDALEAAASLPPWLGVCGNYLGRIGVSALVERADADAARISAALRR